MSDRQHGAGGIRGEAASLVWLLLGRKPGAQPRCLSSLVSAAVSESCLFCLLPPTRPTRVFRTFLHCPPAQRHHVPKTWGGFVPPLHQGWCCSVAQACPTLCDPWTAARRASLSFPFPRGLLIEDNGFHLPSS